MEGGAEFGDSGRSKGSVHGSSREEPPVVSGPSSRVLPAHTDHARSFRGQAFVYPVLSRRSRGISVGINLNPDRACNFDCIYCQVDRQGDPEARFVAAGQVLDELGWTLDLVASGALYGDPAFAGVPDHLRRLNDIAFSGDGEPTIYRNFDAIMAEVVDLKRSRGLDAVKLVLITNATLLDRPHVRRALEVLDRNQGEIWAKLDAGTEAYYRRIDRSAVPFDRILGNLEDAARARPLVIQSMFLRLDGAGPPAEEIAAYVDRLRAIRDRGGSIDRIQVYTVARRPAEANAGPLDPEEVDALAERVRAAVGVPVEAYYGAPA